MRWRVLIGLCLAGVVWLHGVQVAPGRGHDGSCADVREFWLHSDETSTITSEFSWLPPTETCIEERSGLIRKQSYPGPVTWAVAALAFLAPLFVRPPRRQRPTRAATPASQ